MEVDKFRENQKKPIPWRKKSSKAKWKRLYTRIRRKVEVITARWGTVTWTLIVVGVCVIFGLCCLCFGKPGDTGMFGDQYGALTSLFTGIAFAMMVITLRLQRKELRMQREELALTRDEMKGQKMEMAGQRAAMEAQHTSAEIQNFEIGFNSLYSVFQGLSTRLDTEEVYRNNQRELFNFRDKFYALSRADTHRLNMCFISIENWVKTYFLLYEYVKTACPKEYSCEFKYKLLKESLTYEQTALIYWWCNRASYDEEDSGYKLAFEKVDFSMVKVFFDEILDKSLTYDYSQENNRKKRGEWLEMRGYLD